MKNRRDAQKWSEADIAEYLLSHLDYDQWRTKSNGIVVWVTTTGTEMHMMYDLDHRAAAVERFIRRRGRISRDELALEFRETS